MNVMLHVFGILLAIAISSGAAIVAGPATNPANGHVYFLLSQTNWSASEAEAVSLGGHLATIRNTNENAWLLETFQPYAGTYELWIGLTDREQEGTFSWVSGETNKFRNWASGEPNNASGEDYGEMKNGGKWNDVPGSGNGTHYGIVELFVRQTNEPPVVTISRIQSNPTYEVDIAWLSSSNQLYQVLFSLDLNSDSWSSFQIYIQGTGSMIHLRDSAASFQKYYRVVPVE